jgi:hypothetical protein
MIYFVFVQYFEGSTKEDLLVFPWITSLSGISRSEDKTTDIGEWGMVTKCFVASLKFLVRTSKKTAMNVAVIYSSALSNRQQKIDSRCLFVTKQ